MVLSNAEIRKLLGKMQDDRLVETAIDNNHSKSTKTKPKKGGIASLCDCDRKVGGTKRNPSDYSALGKKYAEEIVRAEPTFKGSGNFWGDFKKGFMSVIKPASGIAKKVLPLAGPEGVVASVVLDAIGLGKKPKTKRKVSEATSAKRKRRGALVKQLMKDEGLTLPQASSAVKQRNLEY